MIRMLLFAENSFIASALFSKLLLRLWEFPFAKSLGESVLPGRHCWSCEKRRSLILYFAEKLLLSILQRFTLIIYSWNTHRCQDYYYTLFSNRDMGENETFNNDSLIMIASSKGRWSGGVLYGVWSRFRFRFRKRGVFPCPDQPPIFFNYFHIFLRYGNIFRIFTLISSVSLLISYF